MRRRFLVFLIATATAIASCSLFVDTENLGGNPPANAPPDAAPPPQESGIADAPRDACVADLRSDGKNCGACGHDCLGGACIDSKCQAGSFATVGGAPWYIAQDDRALYIIVLDKLSGPTVGKIVRVDKTTKQVDVLAEGITPAPFDIQVDADYIYWTEAFNAAATKVRKRSKDIAQTELILIGTVGVANELIVVPSHDRILVSGWESSKMYSMSRAAGSAISEITEGGMFRAEGLAYDGTNVFVATSNTTTVQRGQIVRFTPNGTTGVVSHPNAWGRRITVAGDYILGAAGKNFTVVKKADNSQPRSIILAADSFPGNVTYDDATGAAYLANSGGNIIYRSPGPEFLTLEPLVTNQANPIAVIADARAVYWTQGNTGTIGVLAK